MHYYSVMILFVRTGAPWLMVITPVNSTTLTVSWSEVQCLNGSETVTHYIVQYQSSCGGTVKNVTTSGLIQNVSGLTPNCVYTFRVAAVGASQRIGSFSKRAAVSLPGECRRYPRQVDCNNECFNCTGTTSMCPKASGNFH